jgi:hypothetical protein
VSGATPEEEEGLQGVAQRRKKEEGLQGVIKRQRRGFEMPPLK